MYRCMTDQTNHSADTVLSRSHRSAPPRNPLLELLDDGPTGEEPRNLEPITSEELSAFELLSAGFIISSEESPLHESTHLTPAQFALYTKG